jgi:hypothetical protein
MKRRGDRWEITFSRGTRQFDVRCGFLVLCCGRKSRLPATFAANRQRLDRLMCLGVRISGYRGEDFPLVESHAHGWAYSSGLQSGELAIYQFVDPERRAAHASARLPSMLLRELANCPRTAARLLDATATEASDVSFFATDASSTVRRPAMGAGWCLAGDCAQTVDPLSSAGMSYALEHAKLVSGAILKSRSICNPGMSEYADYLSKSYTDCLESRSRVYRSEHRWMTDFWYSRRLASRSN